MREDQAQRQARETRPRAHVNDAHPRGEGDGHLDRQRIEEMAGDDGLRIGDCGEVDALVPGQKLFGIQAVGALHISPQLQIEKLAAAAYQLIGGHEVPP